MAEKENKKFKFKQILSLKEGIFLSIEIITPLIFCIIFGCRDWINLIGAQIGIVSIFFLAKASLLGISLSFVFSLFYAITSLNYKYYGEAIIYFAFMIPLGITSAIIWIINRFKKTAEVTIVKTKKIDFVIGPIASVILTFGLFWLLRYLGTQNIITSTISLFTSFLALYFQLRRSRFTEIFFAANDIVLITLWILATIDDISYLPIVICFVFLLVNDLYGFFNWSKIQKEQEMILAEENN
ncbi:MAG: nicotinamide mononucleotide transporter [Bacilli bacterium]|nr:nicotinamide mononucleotide transporter [Bacilli bacterium]